MAEKMLYIMEEDKQAVVDRISELEQEIQDLGPEFYDVFNQSSETWHDNAPFDALRDRQSVLFAELQSLKTVLRNAELTLPKVNKRRVGIGAVVTIMDVDSKEEKVFFIAGDWTARTGKVTEGATIISTKAPLAEALLGKKEGDTVIFRQRYFIRSIEYQL